MVVTETEGLATSGLGLVAQQAPLVPLVVAPPSEDPISGYGAAVMTAQSARLSLVAEHGALVKGAGGVAVGAAGTGFETQEMFNTGLFNNLGSAPNAASMAADAASPELPELPPLPAVPPPPIVEPRAFSGLLHAAPGSQVLRDDAATVRGQAGEQRADADAALADANGIDASWQDDGAQQAGTNTAAWGHWKQDFAGNVDTLATALDDFAGANDRARAATPTPQTYDDAYAALQRAIDSGDPIAQAEAAREISRLNAATSEAMHTYHGEVTDITARLDAPLDTAPGIVHNARLVDDTTPQDPPRDPKIDGPGSDPQLEQEKYDLGATTPNDPNVLLRGDPDTGKNGLTFPGDGRAIPTGTASGPDGKQYGLFSDAHGDNYVSPQSTVVDLANPSKSLGALRDTSGTNIGQASGAYDSATNTMWIAGNADGTGPRGLWQSAPIDHGNPNGWINTLQSRGTFAGALADFRENQLVALPNNGGFLLTGAGAGTGVQGVTAATPQGLLAAPTQPLVGKIPSNIPGVPDGWAYGPTIVGMQTLPNGSDLVTMRVSTWDSPPPVYDPRTYITTFTISR